MIKTHFNAPKPLSKVDLHPVTIRELLSGHPWITKDSYTAKFPKGGSHLFIGKDHKGEPLCTFIPDSAHKKVKGRLWSFEKPFSAHKREFWYEWCQRFRSACQKRKEMNLISERENFYLVFGEADNLPGIFIQKLGKLILIQFYTIYWKPYLKDVIAECKKTLEVHFPQEAELFTYWSQYRDTDEKNPPHLVDWARKAPEEFFQIQEFGMTYQLHFKDKYDIGLYTDMASIRKKIKPLVTSHPHAKVLNLYAYTGAFSLMSLSAGASEVISVDQSVKYQEWLQENLLLNADTLDLSRHESVIKSVEETLPDLQKQGRTFDVIISDPPSFSSGKVNNKYLETLPQLLNLCNKGAHLVLFMNTHQVKFETFKNNVKTALAALPNGGTYQIMEHLGLGEDCTTMPKFHEGNYLKGLVIKKN